MHSAVNDLPADIAVKRGIATQGDIVALERQPHRPLAASTYELIGVSAAAHPDAPALSFFLRAADHERPRVWSYRALFEQITATANFFHELGIGKDAVVACVLPNLPETHFTLWGGQAAGIVFPVNPLLEPDAIVDLLEAAGAQVLVTLGPGPGADTWQKLQPVLVRAVGLRHVVLVDPSEHVAPHVPRAVGGRRDLATRAAAEVPAHLSVHAFAEGVALQPVDRLLSGRRIVPEDLSSYFCTGGTTGTPKIAMRTHANEVANAWSLNQLFGERDGPPRNLFCGLPLFHVNAMMGTGLYPFSRGDHVVLGTPQGYRGEGVVQRFWEMVERHRIHFFSAVPTLYASLLQQPIGERDISSLEYGLCGAAPMPVELMRNFQQKTGLKILEGYGLTEGTCASTCNPPFGERRLGSIGLRLPLQQMKAVVLDDAGVYVRDCEVGEVGVLVISGPNVFTGYKLAAHNRGLWVRTGDGQRWLNTGDLGRQDADGCFYLTGRRKELIIRGGHNIDPASIEGPLHRHPAVQLAAAVGRPDAHAGELPVAYVQLKHGMMATEHELLAFAQSHIPERAAVPKAIRIVPAMSLTSVGKIFKPEMKRRETEDALRCALAEAGIEPLAFAVHNDAGAGLCAEVTVGNPALQALASEVLGRFPFRFDVSVRAPAATAYDPM